jgi:glycerophosphoryl diester phosphodiesterase
MFLKNLLLFSIFNFMLTNAAYSQFDIQGHRGCRGLMPENTIPAFLKAVELGVTTLEMDVVITADNRVLVSHDPFMSHEICLTPSGDSISEKDEKSFNIYQMTATEAMSFDCGTKLYPRFENQQKMKIGKPLLSDVIDSVELYVSRHHLKPVHYNIETKCTPEGDGLFHPSPEVFVDLLMHVIDTKKITERTIVQSFDIRTLQYLKSQNMPVKMALLVENIEGIEKNISILGFQPDIYSPYFKLIDKNDIVSLHKNGIKVLPWTVNTVKEMKVLIRDGVDGIITDYPNILIEVIKEIK